MSLSEYSRTYGPPSGGDNSLISPISDGSSADSWQSRLRPISGEGPEQRVRRLEREVLLSPEPEESRYTSAFQGGTEQPSWPATGPSASYDPEPTSPGVDRGSGSSFYPSAGEPQPFDPSLWDPKAQTFIYSHNLTRSPSDEEREEGEEPSRPAQTFRRLVKKTSQWGLKTAKSFFSRTSRSPPTRASSISNDSLELSNDRDVTAADQTADPTTNTGWYGEQSGYRIRTFGISDGTYDDPAGDAPTGDLPLGNTSYAYSPFSPHNRKEASGTRLVRKVRSMASTFFTGTGRSYSRPGDEDWYD